MLARALMLRAGASPLARQSHSLLTVATRHNGAAAQNQSLPQLQRQAHRQAQRLCGKNALGCHRCSACSAWTGSSAGGRAMVTRASATDRETALTAHEANNVSPAIAERIGRNLHRREHHPLNNIKHAIETHFNESSAAATGERSFTVFDDLSPIVSKSQNFDELLIPHDHVSRRPSDTFYIDSDRLLRCHTSAHQNELLRAGHEAFLCTGDVYRRDTVDASHYPVFHQMEGVKVFDAVALPPQREDAVKAVEAHLKASLEGMTRALFGAMEMRWVDAHFPFTDPSLELEIFFNGEWLEVLGCGVVQQRILDQTGHAGRLGWAFGLGLERLAMVLYGIPDIRLFWSDDDRFLSQFRRGKATQFKPFSNFPPCLKDVSFWVPAGFHENDFYDTVRNVCKDVAEEVKLVDEWHDQKRGRTSHCYRITYRSMERNLVNEEIDQLHLLAQQGFQLR